MSASQQSGLAVFRMLFSGAHQYLEGTMMGVDSKVLKWSPQPGLASILGQYAHVVTGEDWLVNVKAKGAAPIMATTKAGHTGFRTPPPITGWDEWVREETVDFAALRSYAQTVYQATDDYLASITDRDLERMVDLSEIGMGVTPVAQVLILAASNCCTHTGEISALKGLCGLNGYPVAEAETMPVPA